MTAIWHIRVSSDRPSVATRFFFSDLKNRYQSKFIIWDHLSTRLQLKTWMHRNTHRFRRIHRSNHAVSGATRDGITRTRPRTETASQETIHIESEQRDAMSDPRQTDNGKYFTPTNMLKRHGSVGGKRGREHQRQQTSSKSGRQKQTDALVLFPLYFIVDWCCLVTNNLIFSLYLEIYFKSEGNKYELAVYLLYILHNMGLLWYTLWVYLLNNCIWWLTVKYTKT